MLCVTMDQGRILGGHGPPEPLKGHKEKEEKRKGERERRKKRTKREKKGRETQNEKDRGPFRFGGGGAFL